MSIDIDAASEDRPRPPTCGVCGGPAADAQYLAAYPTDEASALGPTADDGVLPVCGECAPELDDLTAAWSPAPAPALADADSIAAGYGTTSDTCSFCDGALDGGAVLGLDVWSPPADDGEIYALCDHCTDVFDEFLRSIAPE